MLSLLEIMEFGTVEEADTESQWFFYTVIHGALGILWKSLRLLQRVKGPSRQVFSQSVLFYLMYVYVLVLNTFCLKKVCRFFVCLLALAKTVGQELHQII